MWPRNLVVCLALAAAVIVAYWPVRNFSFVDFDDDKYVTDNPHVQDGLTLRGVVWAFRTGHFDNWHPLAWLSHMLDCQMFGLNAGAHHLSSVLIHAANSALLFLAFWRMTGARWRSGFVAALFALHPLHVESVAWVAERKDVLSTLFWMLTVGAYLRYVERPGRLRYLTALMLFALALMAKPMVVTLPCVLLLLDVWPLGRTRWAEPAEAGKSKTLVGRLVMEKIPFFILAGASSVVILRLQHAGGEVTSLAELPMNVRVANALLSYVRYAGKMFWPDGLAPLYPFRSDWSATQVVGAFVLLFAVTVIVARQLRARPFLPVGWFWYLGTLVPVIGIVQAGQQAMADRYTYVPLIGLFVIAAWVIPDRVVTTRSRRILVGAIAAALILPCAVVTSFQVKHWRDTVTLFRHAIRVTGGNDLMHTCLGMGLCREGKLEDGVAQFRRALELNPRYGNAHSNLGVALARLGRPDEALFHYREAVRLAPGYANGHNNLGVALARAGKAEEALAHFREALRLQPDFTKARNNLGTALVELGQTDEAIAHFQEAIRVFPRYAEAHHNLGVALAKQGKLDEAVRALTKALTLNPDSAAAQRDLSTVLTALGRTNEAAGVNPDH